MKGILLILAGIIWLWVGAYIVFVIGLPTWAVLPTAIQTLIGFVLCMVTGFMELVL